MTLYQYLLPSIGFALAGSGSFAERIQSIASQLVEKVDGAWLQLDEKIRSLGDLKKLRDEAVQIVSSLRTVTQDAALSAQSEHFQALVEEFGTAAFRWLVSSVVVGICMAFYVWIALHGVPQVSGTVALLQQIVPRVVMVTLALTAFVFCLRNYAAASHNRVVNLHRATGLKTFQAFMNGTAEKEVKDAILLQAARSIFEAQPSGFLRADGETVQINQVSEAIRAVTPRGQ